MDFLNNIEATSSSSTRRWEYDVFLSFRGEDTREGFTGYLYQALCDKGINTFIDDKLQKGEEISEELIQTIKNSSILVIVFSENYAESKWCLDELAEIVECREKDQEVQIRPVFYNVDPSEIRNQKGNFGTALANHEKKFKSNKDEVQRWRDALRKAANASGWHYKKGLSMHDLIQQMGREVIRQEAPDILKERSRLCHYKDSLEVLTRNEGSKKIRGIMLHSPQLVKVQLHTEAFRRMENLKFLIVENVRMCKPLEFLPNKLILLKWPYYPFHWPSKYFPEQLVAIEMPHSRIRLPKLIKQECHLENLIDVNLKGCKFITELPKLRASNLENLDLSYCKNLVKLRKLLAPNLEYLSLSDCKKLVKLPKLWAPNLKKLYLSRCRNLVEIDEYFGSLEKLEIWLLDYCKNLQILPSQLRLKSLCLFTLVDCSRLEKLPNFHPEMECLKFLYLYGSGIREVPSSIEHLTKLEKLSLLYCKNLLDLPDSIYKLQQLWDLYIPTGKLRPTCNSFDSSSRYGFVKMKELKFMGYEGIIELDLLMKPNNFPELEIIDLFRNNIVTIPESISRFPRLKSLNIRHCKLLREIQGLPQSIRRVDAQFCMLLDTQSPSGLLNQVIEIIGILPSRVCGRARSNKLMDPQLTNYFPSETEGAEYEDGDISMDPQFSNNFPSEIEGAEFEDEYEYETEIEGAESESESESETEGVEYEDGDIDRTIYFWGTEMPKWFNHQSVDNSIFFFVGRKFPKLAVCIVPGREVVFVSIHISINGYKKLDLYFRDLFGFTRKMPLLFDRFKFVLEENNLYLFSLTQRSLQRHLNKSNPIDQNLVEVSITYSKNGYSVKRWGVHVECTCPPQGDDAVDYGFSLMHLFGIL